MTTRAPILLLVLAAACSGDPVTDPTRTGEPQPPVARLIAQNLELIPGAEHAVRIGLKAADDAAHVIVTIHHARARVSICPITSLDGPLPAITSCRRDIGSGVREPVGIPGLRALAIVASGTDAFRADARIEFAEGERAVRIAAPRVRAPAGSSCRDNACNAFFELTPPIAGAFAATASWRGPEATLVLLQGSVLARSQTATGLPYGEPARADGASPLRIMTTLAAPAEYAVVFRHRTIRPGEAALEDVVLEINWPAR
jgi:hypothetical protein